MRTDRWVTQLPARQAELNQTDPKAADFVKTDMTPHRLVRTAREMTFELAPPPRRRDCSGQGLSMEVGRRSCDHALASP